MPGINPVAFGLPALLQGYIQGRQLRMEQDNLEMQKKQNAETSAMNFYKTENQMFRDNPDMANNPEMRRQTAQGMNQRFKAAGMPGIGNDLPQSFGKLLPEDLVANKQEFENFASMTPDQRKSVYGGRLYDPDGGLMNMRQVFLDPNKQTAWINNMNKMVLDVGKGQISPSSLYQTIQNQAPMYNQDPEQMLQGMDFDHMAGEATSANIDRMRASGLLSKERADQMKQETPQIIANMKAKTSLTNTEAGAVSTKLQQGWARISIAQQRLQNDAQRLADTQRRTDTLVDQNNLNHLKYVSGTLNQLHSAAEKYGALAAGIRTGIQQAFMNQSVANNFATYATQNPSTGRWTYTPPADNPHPQTEALYKTIIDQENQANDADNQKKSLLTTITKAEKWTSATSNKIAHGHGAPNSSTVTGSKGTKMITVDGKVTPAWTTDNGKSWSFKQGKLIYHGALNKDNKFQLTGPPTESK